MDQNCDNCIWKIAPCNNNACKTYRNMKGFSIHDYFDHWHPTKPWLKQWDVPKECKILSECDDWYFGIHTDKSPIIEGSPIVWKKSDGKSYQFMELTFPRYKLIPKTPPIEETKEYMEFYRLMSPPHCLDIVELFKDVKKIFKKS